MPVPIVSLALRQLELLYAAAEPDDGVITLYTKRPYGLELFDPTALCNAATRACELACQTDVYHVVNLLAPAACPAIRQRSGRGRESEIQAMVALVADVDVASVNHPHEDYPCQAAALDALDRMPLLPTIVNLSGPTDGGLHVYWALERPVRLVDNETRAVAKAISRGWQERLRRGAQSLPAGLDV